MVDIIEIDLDSSGDHSVKPSNHQSNVQSQSHSREVKNPYATTKSTSSDAAFMRGAPTDVSKDGHFDNRHQQERRHRLAQDEPHLMAGASHSTDVSSKCVSRSNSSLPATNESSMKPIQYEGSTRSTLGDGGLNECTERNNGRHNGLLHSSFQGSKPISSKRSATTKSMQQSETPLIDPSLYRPPSHDTVKPDPIVNYFSIQNRPMASRTMIPVSTIFCQPVSNFWKSKWHSFNHMQSELSSILSQTDDNVVVSAPTGAGKTCIFEIAMGRLFQTQIDKQQRSNRYFETGSTSSPISNSCKIIYISPSKALCQERYNDWAKRLKNINPSLECAMLTGDSSESYSSIQDVENAHLILTTPEKWDLITRKWTDNFFLIGSVKLILIDEVHFIGTVDRGACLEAVICRMKTVQRAVKAHGDHLDSKGDDLGPDVSMRVVAVSATLPNVVDIANFLDAKKAYVFDSTYRPVPLTTHVVGLGYIGKNQFLFDKGLNRHVPDLMNRFAKGRSTIIFCHTKKGTEVLATELITSCGRNDPLLSQLAQNAKLETLKKCLLKGIAFHHAGMENADRKLVEDNFSKGLIKCLCATSTLAMGVNLPAHLVIIKGTSVWRGAGQGYQELDSGTLLQMMGRAGRPGFDKSGTAVIMTDTKSKPKYEQMSSGLEVVESMLLNELTETLNIEISQRVITSVKEAVDWIKDTFFFIRVRKNPKHYGIKQKNDSEIESYLMQNCMDAIQNLCRTKIINLYKEGNKIEPRKASHVMSRHMVPFQGMEAIVALPHDSGVLQILHCLSNMEGIQFPVRRSEKSLLNDAHKLIKHKLNDGPPSKIRVQNPDQKAFVLLQAAIGQHYFNDFTLRQEMSSSIEFASRILSAMEDYSIEESGHGQVALEALLLRRCLSTSLWSANDGVLNQLRGVGAKSAAKLAMNNVRTFNDIMMKSSNEIEQACGRKSPFGQELKKVVSKIMSNSLKVEAFVEGLNCDDEPNELICNVMYQDVNSPLEQNANVVEAGVVTYTLAVHTDRPNGSLMFRTDISGPGSHRVRCPQKFGRIYLHLVSNLIGLDEKFTINGNDTVQKSSFMLSPQKPKKSISNTVKSPNPKPTPKSLEKMVLGVEDLRLPHKARKKQGVSAGSKISQRQVSSTTKVTERKQPLVTPSPVQVMKSRVEDRISNVPTRVSTNSPNPTKRGSNHQFIIREPTPVHINSPNLTKRGSNHQSTIREPTPVHINSPNLTKRGSNHQSTIREPTPVPINSPKPTKRGSNHQSVIREPMGHRMHLGSWQRQKKRQKRFQQRAFGSPKENPFSMFKFDPNNVEKQLEIELESHAVDKSASEVGQTIFPASSQGSQHQAPPSRRSYNYSRMESKALKQSSSKLIGSLKRRKVGTPIQSRQPDLLRQKAAEQQYYVAASRHRRINQHDVVNISEPQNAFGLVRQDNNDLFDFYGADSTNHHIFENTTPDDFQQQHDQTQYIQQDQGTFVSPTPNSSFHVRSHVYHQPVENFNDIHEDSHVYPQHVDNLDDLHGDSHFHAQTVDNFNDFQDFNVNDNLQPFSSTQPVLNIPETYPDVNHRDCSPAPCFEYDNFLRTDLTEDPGTNMEGMVISCNLSDRREDENQQPQQANAQGTDDDFDIAFF